jgi:hypothetical protein
MIRSEGSLSYHFTAASVSARAAVLALCQFDSGLRGERKRGKAPGSLAVLLARGL